MSRESNSINNASQSFEENHINYAYIVAPRTLDARLEALDRELERVSYISLTDAISYSRSGGALVMETLAAENPSRKFKIQVLKDEWGNVPKPGDIVTRKIQKKMVDRAGRKLRGNAVNDMKRRGTFDKKYIDVREFVVDDKGCIECDYDDAGWLLATYGVHCDSDAAMGGRREFSKAPCEAPDGQMMHVHYWRYKEAPPWLYSELPDLTKTEPKKKRGLSPAPDDKPHADKAAAVD